MNRQSMRSATRIALWVAILLHALPVCASLSTLNRQGLSAMSEHQPEEALAFFEKAENAARAEATDPAPALINQALALIRLGRMTDARDKLAAAMETPDLSLRARAQYALGTLMGELADGAAQEDSQLEAAVRAYEDSLKRLESAIRLNSEKSEARFNYELAQARLRQAKRRLAEMPKPEEQQDEEKPAPQPQDPDKPESAKGGQDEPDSGDEQTRPEQDPSDAQPETDPSWADGASEGREISGDEMSEEEARMILDAMRDEEEMHRGRIRILRGEPVPVDKDW